MNITPPSEWLINSSPHVRTDDSVTRIMGRVLIALIPAFGAALWFFGWDALRLTLACTVTCVAAEWASRAIMKRDRGINDLSAALTGVLLAFNLPPQLPTWMAVLGSLVAIVIAKQLYGGIGYNLFNPALIGRTFLLVSFPVAMTTWLAPSVFPWADAVTTATPLGIWKTTLNATQQAPPDFFQQFSLSDLLSGNRPGCIGETCSLALLAGAAYLLATRCITWHIPFSMIFTVAIGATILYKMDPSQNLPPHYHLLTGGLLLGAFFMATDMVTTPVTRGGMIIFGVGCGLITLIIRKWGGYPEGVSFSILIMNSLTPLINRLVRPRVFGHAPQSKPA
jgi:electron transport complex protein RnfD